MNVVEDHSLGRERFGIGTEGLDFRGGEMMQQVVADDEIESGGLLAQFVG